MLHQETTKILLGKTCIWNFPKKAQVCSLQHLLTLLLSKYIYLQGNSKFLFLVNTNFSQLVVREHKFLWKFTLTLCIYTSKE